MAYFFVKFYVFYSAILCALLYDKENGLYY